MDFNSPKFYFCHKYIDKKNYQLIYYTLYFK